MSVNYLPISYSTFHEMVTASVGIPVTEGYLGLNHLVLYRQSKYVQWAIRIIGTLLHPDGSIMEFDMI